MSRKPRSSQPAEPRNVLVITLGGAPGVVTETVWALLDRKAQWRPDEIHLVTTNLGAKDWNRDDTEPRRQLRALLAFFGIPPIVPNILVPRDDAGNLIDDIRTESENVAFATDLTRLIKQLSDREGVRLHVSMAGGRKTMSSYAHAAISLCGGEHDELSHILVEPKALENNPRFFWPKQEDQDVDIGDAKIIMVPSPFVRLRRFLDRIPLAQQDFNHRTLVEKVQASVDRYLVELVLPTRTLRVGSERVTFTNQEFALYRLLVTALKEAWPGYGPGGCGHNHRGWISNMDFLDPRSRVLRTFFAHYAACFPGAPDKHYDDFKEEIEKRLTSEKAKDVDYVANRFKDLRRKVKEQIERTLSLPSARNRVMPGNGYVAKSARRKHHWSYGLYLEGHEIDVVDRPEGTRPEAIAPDVATPQAAEPRPTRPPARTVRARGGRPSRRRAGR